MRSTILATIASVVALGTTVVATPALGDPGSRPDSRVPATSTPTAAAERALNPGRNRELPATAADPADRDRTLDLLDRYQALPRLTGADRQRAEAALARPTQGANDPYGDGYTVREATPVCGTKVCIHYVPTTADAPPMADGADADTIPDHVQRVRTVMQAVWSKEVGSLGYRAPATDGTRGGNSKFDVYLADIGDQGLYGYCAPEVGVSGQRHRASGFCVLDDDFASAQFPTGTPDGNLRVTAAHEFFHAIQFNYDADEDHWIMEATATWMEERYADDVNDNRNYLSGSHMHRPGTPLDVFQSGGGAQYGNWIFFERISQRFGLGAIKAIWTKLDGSTGAPNQYSIQAVKSYLAGKSVSFQKFYASFGAGNLVPGRTYSEGANYANSQMWAPVAKAWNFPDNGYVPWQGAQYQHLTNRNFAFVPGDTMTGSWRLRVTVDAPDGVTGSAAHVLVLKADGSVVDKPVSLNRYGNGSVVVGFTRATVSAVTLTLANGSTRYRCNAGTGWSCHGSPLDNGRTYKYKATAIR